MTRSSSLSPYQQGARPVRESTRTPTRSVQGVADFLRAHDRMAALLPAVTRMAALQKDCAALLPDMFASCEVLQFESGLLAFSIPNAALAAKLKQKLPKLQEALQQRGWQVNAIRLKVQVRQPLEKRLPTKQIVLSERAVSALANLGASLEDSPRNAALKTALDVLVKRQRSGK